MRGLWQRALEEFGVFCVTITGYCCLLWEFSFAQNRQGYNTVMFV